MQIDNLQLELQSDIIGVAEQSNLLTACGFYYSQIYFWRAEAFRC